MVSTEVLGISLSPHRQTVTTKNIDQLKSRLLSAAIDIGKKHAFLRKNSRNFFDLTFIDFKLEYKNRENEINGTTSHINAG
ncbi:hypothetical protein CR156_18945 [Stenotrophomonas lactitubi]|nr:hypothetical protein CR156_18945 [Stenotrophomonas lactitubi]